MSGCRRLGHGVAAWRRRRLRAPSQEAQPHGLSLHYGDHLCLRRMVSEGVVRENCAMRARQPQQSVTRGSPVIPGAPPGGCTLHRGPQAGRTHHPSPRGSHERGSGGRLGLVADRQRVHPDDLFAVLVHRHDRHAGQCHTSSRSAVDGIVRPVSTEPARGAPDAPAPPPSSRCDIPSRRRLVGPAGSESSRVFDALPTSRPPSTVRALGSAGSCLVHQCAPSLVSAR